MQLVWIVEDDLEMQQAIKLFLKLMDMEVVSYSNARSAADKLITGERPDIFILDIMMPEVSGIDFLEFVRRQSKFDDIPIVMLSSETADVQVDEAMRLGADAFVFKPVTFEEFQKAIECAINARLALS